MRTALVGYGLAGRVIHRRPLQLSGSTTITHVVTSDPARQEQARLDLPGAAVVSTADELFTRADELDLVVIATSNDAHVPLALRALHLGKPVVVDKPLALTSADADLLAGRARELGVLMSVFHNRRWDSDTLTARALLDDGRLGTVHRLESRFTRFRPQVGNRWREQPGSGGILLDLGTHLVDQAAHLLGPVVCVYADVARRRAAARVDDDVLLVLTHRDGATSVLWCSAAAPWPGPRLVLQGSTAGWAKQELDGQEQAQQDDVPLSREPDGVLWDHAGARAEASLPGDWSAFYRAMAAAVRGLGPVPVDAQDGVAALRVLEAARLSSHERRVVEIEAV